MKQNIKTLWKSLADSKSITAANMIEYAILRAMASKSGDKPAVAKHLIRKSFTPITRPMKLANGCEPFHALSRSMNPVTLRRSVISDGKQGWSYEAWNGVPYTIIGVPVLDLLTEDEIVEFNEIYKEITPKRVVRRYSYFFTRQDIFAEYQLVQTAHVALELGNKLTPDQVKDLHFTVCGVPDLEALEAVERVLQSIKAPYEVFKEPDIGNQKTSIGVYPIEEHKRGILKSYGLLRHKNNEE